MVAMSLIYASIEPTVPQYLVRHESLIFILLLYGKVVILCIDATLSMIVNLV